MKTIKYGWNVSAILKRISEKPQIRKKLLDILNNTLKISNSLKDVVIVKNNGKVTLYSAPFNKEDLNSNHKLKGPYDLNDGILDWIKNTYIPRERFNLVDEIQL